MNVKKMKTFVEMGNVTITMDLIIVFVQLDTEEILLQENVSVKKIFFKLKKFSSRITNLLL